MNDIRCSRCKALNARRYQHCEHCGKALRKDVEDSPTREEIDAACREIRAENAERLLRSQDTYVKPHRTHVDLRKELF